MNYKSCAIEINKKCLLECRHCCQSYKIGKDYISIYDFKEIVKKTCQSSRIKAICLTGGEVFSNIDLLVKYFEIFKKTNKYLTLVTSAYWSSSYEKTLDLSQN